MSTRRSAASIVLAAVLSLAGAGVLTGCVPEQEPPAATEPSASTPPSTDPSSHGPSSPEPSPSDTPEAPTPVSIPCASVIGSQTMYDFNPNFGLLADFSPDAGSLAARALNDRGTACRWINQTSGDTIDVAISRPGPTAFASAKMAAAAGTAVSGLGDEAYFSAAPSSSGGDVGTVQAFRGPFWISATSVYFQAPGDAQTLMTDAVAATR